MNNQYVIPLFVSGSLLLTLFTFFLIAYLLVQKNKQNKYQQEKRQMEFEKLQMESERRQMEFDHQNKILKAKNDEQEATMNQISKELHDNVKSLLGFAEMSMHNIADMATNPEQATLIETTKGIIHDVIEDLHNISHSLSSEFVKNIGLIETIGKELEYVRLAKNIAAELTIIGEPYSIGGDKEIQIYRIAQEAIQNCRKHAKATSIIFTLDYAPGQFSMKIADNGKGFEVKKRHEMTGIGLVNMYKRADYVQGALEIQSAPMQGSTITLTLNPNEDGINS